MITWTRYPIKQSFSIKSVWFFLSNRSRNGVNLKRSLGGVKRNPGSTLELSIDPGLRLCLHPGYVLRRHYVNSYFSEVRYIQSPILKAREHLTPRVESLESGH